MGRGGNIDSDPTNLITGLRASRDRNRAAFAELGIDPATIESARREQHARMIAPTLIETPDGDPIIGLSYQTDYKAEEEWGVADLRKAITGPDPIRFAQTPEGAECIRFFSDCNGMVLSTGPRTDAELAWGDPVGEFGDTRYRGDYEFALFRIAGIDRWTTVPELRAKAKELGVKPLPSRKEDLIAAITGRLSATGDSAGLVAPAWFQSGNDLVIRADGDGPAARVVAKLVAAARAGRLGIGDGSGPFHSGLVLFDAADMTPGQITEITEQHRWHAERMAELEPVKQELLDRGYRFYFLGNPKLIRRKGDSEERLYYWLNAMSSRNADGSYSQPSGWFTLDELRAAKFADGQG